MNRFEAMLAPPTLSGKEMAMHVKMQSAIPREEANILRSEMFVPKVRLYDELTTLRFRRPGPEAESFTYRAFCKALTGAGGEGIPYRFFKGEFARLLEEMGMELPEDDAESRPSRNPFRADRVKRTIRNLDDPWRVQAYAALCARVAENSEVSDPRRAAGAWDMAFELYGLFFDAAEPEQSTTYKQQREEKLQQDTIDAWLEFRQQLLDGIVSRVKGYIQDKKPQSISACLDALDQESLRHIDPGAHERALSDSFLPYVSALSSAPNLKEAGTLYDKIPAALLEQDSRQEFARAMLAAMTSEVDRLKSNGNSVAGVISWSNKLQTEQLCKSGAPLTKKAADDFYEACGAYVRDALDSGKTVQKRASYGDALCSIIPEHIVIARAGDKELHRENLLGMCTTLYIREQYNDKLANVRSESSARDLGQELYNLIKRSLIPGSRQEDTQRQLMQNLIVSVQKSKMSVPHQRSFFAVYPDDLPIVDKDLKTVGGYKRMLNGAGGGGGGGGGVTIPEGLVAMKEFSEAEDGTHEKFAALAKVIAYALDHPDEDMRGDTYLEMADICCRNAFIAALNKKDSVSSFTFRCDYKPIMELAASFLPGDYQFPAGSGRTMAMNLLEKVLELQINYDMRRKAAKLRKKKPGGGHRPPHQGDGLFKEIGKELAKKVLGPLVIFGILFLIFGRQGEYAPGAARFFIMLFRTACIFQIPIAVSAACITKNRAKKFWNFIQTLVSAAYLPVVVYSTIQMFHFHPNRIVLIILGVIYLILCVFALIATAVKSD